MGWMALVLAVTLSGQPIEGAYSEIKQGEVEIYFYDMERIAGPITVYASTENYPKATGCPSCSGGIVEPQHIISGLPGDKNGQYIEVEFDHALVDYAPRFFFTATSQWPDGERFVASWWCPYPKAKGQRE